MERPLLRKIIHVDMDAFYASVEQLDQPCLRGKPIAVGGSSKRGVVAAASYEARRFGVYSAMSSVLALKKCPDLLFITPRFQRYKEVSSQIRSIFYEYTDLVEPLSLDEAYLDVTENKKGNPSASLIAQEIRSKIFSETGLTASAGISINKFLAKVASDVNKPNGQKTISPEEVQEFLDDLEIRKFHGVGKVTTEKMYRLGIFTGRDLRQKPEEFLNDHFASSGSYYYQLVRGIHLSEVKASRSRKSLGAEETFEENISSEIYLLEKLEKIAAELEERALKKDITGRTVTLKIKYSDFSLQTRSKTLSEYLKSKEDLLDHIKTLLFQEKLKDSVRLLGISLSNLKEDDEVDKEVLVQLKFDF